MRMIGRGTVDAVSLIPADQVLDIYAHGAETMGQFNKGRKFRNVIRHGDKGKGDLRSLDLALLFHGAEHLDFLNYAVEVLAADPAVGFRRRGIKREIDHPDDAGLHDLSSLARVERMAVGKECPSQHDAA